MRAGTRVALVPGVLALLPEYAALHDPVADLRAACRRAVAWLAEDGAEVSVLADAQGERVARALLEEAGAGGGDSGEAVLAVLSGSARRRETSPGYVDPRAVPFDDSLGAALRAGDTDALAATDVRLGEELWARGLEALPALARALAGAGPATVDYDDDPYGVQYWVLRWGS